MADLSIQRLLRVARGGLAGLAIEVAIVGALAVISILVALVSSLVF